jgi:hypothetical protein
MPRAVRAVRWPCPAVEAMVMEAGDSERGRFLGRFPTLTTLFEVSLCPDRPAPEPIHHDRKPARTRARRQASPIWAAPLFIHLPHRLPRFVSSVPLGHNDQYGADLQEAQPGTTLRREVLPSDDPFDPALLWRMQSSSATLTVTARGRTEPSRGSGRPRGARCGHGDLVGYLRRCRSREVTRVCS